MLGFQRSIRARAKEQIIGQFIGTAYAILIWKSSAESIWSVTLSPDTFPDYVHRKAEQMKAKFHKKD